MKARMTGYWVATVFIALELAVGGFMDLTNGREMVVAGQHVDDVVRHLGYPTYLTRLLGAWKLLGAVALVAPRNPRLKEWAYAGTFFELTGAAISHNARASY
jgi:uncharacterized membrane protein YphA (DoxX/SURF4 family)